MKKLLPFLFVIASLFPILAQAQTCVIPTGGTINGSANGCSDRTSTYTITGVVNATTYNWVITGAQGFTKVSSTEYSKITIYGLTNSILKNKQLTRSIFTIAEESYSSIYTLT